MKFQKIILCLAIALTAFGASLGLLEIGNYLREALTPIKVEIKTPAPIQLPVVYPPLAPAVSPPVPAPTEESAPVEEVDYGETGDYYIIGENPDGFEDFDILSVSTVEYSEKLQKVVPVKPTGSLTMKKEFKFSRISLNKGKFSFVTKTRKGLSYQFDGKFIETEYVEVKNEDGEKYTEEVVLKGRLIKWRDGKKIAEAKVKLAGSHGC